MRGGRGTTFRNVVNASKNDVVVFMGSGATGAVHKLVHSLKPKIG